MSASTARRTALAALGVGLVSCTRNPDPGERPDRTAGPYPSGTAIVCPLGPTEYRMSPAGPTPLEGDPNVALSASASFFDRRLAVSLLIRNDGKRPLVVRDVGLTVRAEGGRNLRDKLLPLRAACRPGGGSTIKSGASCLLTADVDVSDGWRGSELRLHHDGVSRDGRALPIDFVLTSRP